MPKKTGLPAFASLEEQQTYYAGLPEKIKAQEKQDRKDAVEFAKEKAKRHRAKLKARRKKTLQGAAHKARMVAKKARKDAKYYRNLKLSRTQIIRDVRNALRVLYSQIREASAKLKGAQDAYDAPREAMRALAYARGFNDGKTAAEQAAYEASLNAAAKELRLQPDKKEGRPWIPDSLAPKE